MGGGGGKGDLACVVGVGVEQHLSSIFADEATRSERLGRAHAPPSPLGLEDLKGGREGWGV